MAGGPGDRWSGLRKMAGWEESPDTVLSHVRNKGNAPGNARGAVRVAQASACTVCIAHGKCHRKCTAGDAQHGGIAQVNLRDVFESLASFGADRFAVTPRQG
jgi:hypothetical protein